MPRDTFKRAVGRMLDGPIAGSATLTHYVAETDGNGDVIYDEQGDPNKTQDAQQTGVPALFRRPRAGMDLAQDDMGGIDQTFDAIVWVPDDYDAYAPGDDGRRFGTRIEDETTGDTFDVIDVWNEKNGNFRCAVKQV